jgi:PEP-CTERM motif
MRKLLLTLALIGITAVCHAQGTISWGNDTFTRIFIVPLSGDTFPPTAADGFTFSLYYGPAGSTAEQLVFSGALAQIGEVPGVLAGAPRVIALPGTVVGETISLQIRASHPSGIPIINPPVRQVVPGRPPGLGAVIWSLSPSSRTFYIAPEPGTLALAGLAGILFGVARWRRR